MATCIRSGVRYKRHQYVGAVTEVDGTKVSQLVCKACGKVSLNGSFLDYNEKFIYSGLDKAVETV